MKHWTDRYIKQYFTDAEVLTHRLADLLWCRCFHEHGALYGVWMPWRLPYLKENLNEKAKTKQNLFAL